MFSTILKLNMSLEPKVITNYYHFERLEKKDKLNLFISEVMNYIPRKKYLFPDVKLFFQ